MKSYTVRTSDNNTVILETHCIEQARQAMQAFNDKHVKPGKSKPERTAFIQFNQLAVDAINEAGLTDEYYKPCLNAEGKPITRHVFVRGIASQIKHRVLSYMQENDLGLEFPATFDRMDYRSVY